MTKPNALIVTDVSAAEYAKRGGGNYLIKIAALQKTLKPGKAYRMEIRHDNWCLLLKGKAPCNCDPDVWAEEQKQK